MNEQHLTVHVHDEGDVVWAEIVELPGLFASGDDVDGRDALEEALTLYLSDETDRIEIKDWSTLAAGPGGPQAQRTSTLVVAT